MQPEGRYDRLRRTSSWRRTAFLYAGLLGCLAGFSGRDAYTRRWAAPAVPPELPDARPFGYSTEALQAYFVAIGDDGKCLYVWTQLSLDVAFPLLYAAFLATLTAHACPRWLGRRAVWLPVAMAVADLGENLLLALLAWDVLPVAPEWVIPAATLTVAKWGLGVAIGVVLLLGVTIRISQPPTDTAAA